MSYQKRVIEKEVAVCCLNYAEAAVINNAQQSLVPPEVTALARIDFGVLKRLPGSERVAFKGSQRSAAAQPQWTL